MVFLKGIIVESVIEQAIDHQANRGSPLSAGEQLLMNSEEDIIEKITPVFRLADDIRKLGVAEVFVVAETFDKAKITSKACVTKLLMNGSCSGCIAPVRRSFVP